MRQKIIEKNNQKQNSLVRFRVMTNNMNDSSRRIQRIMQSQCYRTIIGMCARLTGGRSLLLRIRKAKGILFRNRQAHGNFYLFVNDNI